MIYDIFGRVISITSENREIEIIFSEELKLYSSTDRKLDIQIDFVNDLKFPDHYSNSPRIHYTFDNGFIVNYGSCYIQYSKKDALKVLIKIKDENAITKKIKKYKNIGYKSIYENVTALLYELILVPSNYFYNDRALVHASSMKNLVTGKTIMFGGTGGVGKTSLELLLCRERGYSFISDDIAVVDKEGYIHPNLAYPKIYAYNVEKNRELETILFKHRNILDRLQWATSKKIRGLNKARRTISPDVIFDSFERNKCTAHEYYILSISSEVDTIEIEKINSVNASIMTLKIIINEYHAFNQHISWHEYNALLLGIKPVLELDSVHSNWLNIYNNIFSGIDCYSIKISPNVSHSIFLSKLKEYF